MASYALIIMAFLVVYLFSIIETTSAARSEPPSVSDSLGHPQSEPVKPPTRTTNNNNNALEQSMGQVPPPFPFYYPYSYGQGYPYSYGQGYPYYGQPGQPSYLPNNQIPPVYPATMPYPYPYSSYNPTMPYPQGPSTIYGPPSIGVAGPDRVSSKASP